MTNEEKMKLAFNIADLRVYRNQRQEIAEDETSIIPFHSRQIHMLSRALFSTEEQQLKRVWLIITTRDLPKE